MFVVNQLGGFGAGGNLVQTLIDRTDGTALGDMTDSGGLAASFDGDTTQTAAQSSNGSDGANTTYIGKDWGAAVTRRVSGFKAYGSSDEGFFRGVNPSDCVFTLQGSTDNFSGSIVDLGAVSAFTDSNSLTKEKLTGITTSTAYRYHRLKFVASVGAGEYSVCTECQFYEDVES